MKDAPLTKCPECGRKGGVKRKIGGGAGLIFKGTGFYITDYKAKPSPGSEGGSGGKSEPAKTTQPAAKPAPAAGAAKS